MKNLLILLTLLLLVSNPLAAQESESTETTGPAPAQEPKQTPDVVDDSDAAKSAEPAETPVPLTPRDEALLQDVWDGDLAKVELIVKKGANVNSAEPKKKRTPLMLAATKRNLDVVRFLVEKGADVNARDSDGQTALMYACRQRFNDVPDNSVAIFLLDNGAEVNLRSTKKGYTALMLASGAGNAELVRKMLEKGADPSIEDNFGVTAAEVAQETGKTAIVEMLSTPSTSGAAH
jgi:ankyrin repeat protein